MSRYSRAGRISTGSTNAEAIQILMGSEHQRGHFFVECVRPHRPAVGDLARHSLLPEPVRRVTDGYFHGDHDGISGQHDPHFFRAALHPAPYAGLRRSNELAQEDDMERVGVSDFLDPTKNQKSSS